MGTERFRYGVAILLGLGTAACAAEVQGQTGFRSNSYVVQINATVLDRASRPVRGLTRDHFRLFQDKRQQTITYFGEEEVPLSLAIVFDTSGSMLNNIAGARRALREMLATSNAGDEFCLIRFAERPEVAIPWVSDQALLQNSVLLTPAKGQTALLDAIRLALAQTKRAANPRRAILIISDGGDNYSRYRESEIASMLTESNVEMYAVDMADVRSSPEEWLGPGLLERLCERTGGRYFQGHDGRELSDIAERISKELRSEYVLGFIPPKDGTDGKFHHVQLRVERPGGPKLSVYWRHGYRVPVE